MGSHHADLQPLLLPSRDRDQLPHCQECQWEETDNPTVDLDVLHSQNIHGGRG